MTSPRSNLPAWTCRLLLNHSREHAHAHARMLACTRHNPDNNARRRPSILTCLCMCRSGCRRICGLHDKRSWKNTPLGEKEVAEEGRGSLRGMTPTPEGLDLTRRCRNASSERACRDRRRIHTALRASVPCGAAPCQSISAIGSDPASRETGISEGGCHWLGALRSIVAFAA